MVNNIQQSEGCGTDEAEAQKKKEEGELEQREALALFCVGTGSDP